MRAHAAVMAILLLFALQGNSVSRAETLLVPTDYPTIQSAIKDAVPGDEVAVEDGLYSGLENHNLDFLGKTITVRSLNLSPADCIIDCEGGTGERRAFHFMNGEGPGAVVAGFTIRNGLAVGGGAIRCESGSTPTISGCIFENNQVFGSANGGAIYADSGLTISDCSFVNNSAPGGSGGAVFSESGSPWITGNTFTGNTAFYGGAIYLRGSLEAQVSENRVSGSSAYRGGGLYIHLSQGDSIAGNMISNNLADWGAGIYLEGCVSVKITGNVIVGNKALLYGGGIHAREECSIDMRQDTIAHNLVTSAFGSGGGINAGWGSTVTISNTILWGNSAAQGPAIAAREEPGNSIFIDCSDVEGGQASCSLGHGSSLDWGTAMIGVDPMFCNAGEDDYGLDQHSICTAEAQPDCGRIGARDVGCAGQVISVSLGCVPDSGTLIFQTMLSLELTNLCVSQHRRVAGRLDVMRADGSLLTYWRHGWMNLPAGVSYARTWPLLLPPRPSMVGENRFILAGMDVTPPPYNQPPYWPSGETQSDFCVITAALPGGETVSGTGTMMATDP